MAKTTRRKKRKADEQMVSLVFDRPMEFELSKELQKEPEMLRRLAHRTMDFLADRGNYASLASSVEGVLSHITDEVMLQFANDLIREARAEGKEAAGG